MLSVWRPTKRVYLDYSINVTEMNQILTEMQAESEHYDRMLNHSTLESMDTAQMIGRKNRAYRTVKAAAEQDRDKRIHPSWRDKRNVVGSLISTLTGLATEEELIVEHKQMEKLQVGCQCRADLTYDKKEIRKH